MLFKNSTKSKAGSKFESEGQTYLERVNFKTANKETNIYTYWNDSSAYQLMNIRENVDEIKRSTASTDEKQMLQQQQEMKKSEPPDLWLYWVFAVVVIGVVMLMVKFWKKA